MKKKRFIVGHRHGPKLDPQSSKELETFAAGRPNANIVGQTSVGRWIVEMDEDEMREFAHKNPQLVVEEDRPLKMMGLPGLPERVEAQGNYTVDVSVTDAADHPISGATIYGIGAGASYRVDTDDGGTAVLRSPEQILPTVVASPRDSYWASFTSDLSLNGGKYNFKLKPLLTSGAYDWGHRVMNFPAVNRTWKGRGIRIGVVDSGISNKHKDLRPAAGYNTLDGQDPAAWNVDEKGHGTHVGGILAALNNTIGVVGGAPDAEIYSIKVFPGGYISDLVEAVEWCIHHRMDVINLSLGSQQPSTVLAQVLRDAYDRGITSVAATGNEHTQVAFPAALPFVIAVGAIGVFGTFPESSAHALRISRVTDWQRRFFAANLSNYGPEVNFCAPGVAVLSTVPTGYAAWDGTSMACPMVSALAALVLEAFPSIRTGDPQQVEYIRSILFNASANLGMPPLVQGAGLPLADRAVAYARYVAPQRQYQWRWAAVGL